MAKSKPISSAADVVEYRPKPTLRIDSEDFKGTKDLKVGETRTFSVTAKVMSVSQGDEFDEDNSSKTTRATLRVTKISEK